MVKLDASNVLLKPSHRRQILGWLRRPVKMGEQVGDLSIQISLRRIGRACQGEAQVHDKAGRFDCRSRGQHWRDVGRDLAHKIGGHLHDQRLALGKVA